MANKWLGYGIVAVLLILVLGGASQQQQSVSPDDQTGPGSGNEPAGGVSCPSDSDTSVSVDVVNSLNTTGSEGFDVTGRFVGDSGHIVKITDTTSPTASTLNCGEHYVFMIESANGASGNNSVVKSINNGEGRIVDGNLEFTATGGSMSFEIGVEQQATLQCRMKDIDNDALMYDSGDASAIDYETDGVTFESTTGNTTATAIGSGGDFHFQLECKAVQDDTNWNDRGWILLIEAPSTEYDVDNFVVKVNGATESEGISRLTTFEKRKWNDYELAYVISNVDVTNNENVVIDVSGSALAGTDASTDLQFDIGARGQYLKSSSSNAMAVGAVKDDSSGTVVRTVYDATIDVS